jgi:integrase
VSAGTFGRNHAMRRRASEGETVGVDEPSSWSAEGQEAPRGALSAGGLHDLRHSHATLALAAGIHPKVVSERLGHATVSITLDTYSHAIPALQEEAAERIAELVLAGG